MTRSSIILLAVVVSAGLMISGCGDQNDLPPVKTSVTVKIDPAERVPVEPEVPAVWRGVIEGNTSSGEYHLPGPLPAWVFSQDAARTPEDDQAEPPEPKTRRVRKKAAPAGQARSNNQSIVTVSVSTFRTREKAQEEAARLKARGLDPWIQERTSDTGAIFHRVCIGRFESNAEAGQTAQHLHQTGKIDSFLVVSLDNTP